MLLIVACTSVLVRAQDEEDEFTEDSKVNTNIAIPLSVPLNPIARLVNFGWGVTVGAGYNLSRRNALIGEFMYNRLAISSAALAPLRLALHSRDLSGSGNLYAITAN